MFWATERQPQGPHAGPPPGDIFLAPRGETGGGARLGSGVRAEEGLGLRGPPRPTIPGWWHFPFFQVPWGLAQATWLMREQRWMCSPTWGRDVARLHSPLGISLSLRWHWLPDVSCPPVQSGSIEVYPRVTPASAQLDPSHPSWWLGAPWAACFSCRRPRCSPCLSPRPHLWKYHTPAELPART